MNEHSIGKTIANLRKSKGWTQVELAEKLMVSDKAISKWESEAGFPEISQLPVMAKLFNVTIDYLMTGKVPEKEIVIMSKMELCAKNDDIKLLEGITLKTRDENGKSILAYAKTYNSKNVLREIILKYGKCAFDELVDHLVLNSRIVKAHFAQALSYALMTNTFSVLKDTFNNLQFQETSVHYRSAEKDPGLRLWVYVSNLTEADLEDQSFDKVFDLLVNTNIVHYTVYKFMFDKRKDEFLIKNSAYSPVYSKLIWRDGLMHLLKSSYQYNNLKLFNKYVEKIKQWDKESSIAIGLAENDTTRKKFGSDNRLLEETIRQNPLIGFSQGLIEMLLEKGDIALAEELHNHNIIYNIKSVESDKIRIAKLKLDKSISKMELKVQSAIHNGILSVNELLAINDFKTIKKALYQYPIHIIELLCNIKKQGRRAVFKFAIDSNDKELANMVLNDSLNEKNQTNMGSYYAETLFDHILIKYWKIDHKDNYTSRIKTTADMLKSLQEQRGKIITELSLKIDKEKVVGELTNEYFENELAKGNIEIVIIKLCVRMEAILRCDYHYDGDFSEMLTKYCNTFNTYDDEDNDYDPYTPEMLHKLRMQRNGIVHSEKCKECLSVKDIKWCIDYICKLG